jgi:hypothetical protein
MALKAGYTHLSLDFLFEFKAALPEFEVMMQQGTDLSAEPVSDMEEWAEEDFSGIDKQSDSYEDFHHDG